MSRTSILHHFLLALTKSKAMVTGGLKCLQLRPRKVTELSCSSLKNVGMDAEIFLGSVFVTFSVVRCKLKTRRIMQI